MDLKLDSDVQVKGLKIHYDIKSYMLTSKLWYWLMVIDVAILGKNLLRKTHLSLKWCIRTWTFGNEKWPEDMLPWGGGRKSTAYLVPLWNHL